AVSPASDDLTNQAIGAGPQSAWLTVGNQPLIATATELVVVITIVVETDCRRDEPVRAYGRGNVRGKVDTARGQMVAYETRSRSGGLTDDGRRRHPRANRFASLDLLVQFQHSVLSEALRISIALACITCLGTFAECLCDAYARQ